MSVNVMSLQDHGSRRTARIKGAGMGTGTSLRGCWEVKGPSAELTLVDIVLFNELKEEKIT